MIQRIRITVINLYIKILVKLIWTASTENEINNLEHHLLGLNPLYFGKKVDPTRAQKAEERKNKRPSLGIMYCDCADCTEIDVKFPKQSNRVTK